MVEFLQEKIGFYHISYMIKRAIFHKTQETTACSRKSISPENGS
ncbi:hypothetical protein LMG3441_05287 [Achromobacter kerstersii]|uniref:Uncharacterized protein n=1 Tax=Achromobacter kerstersii TaxID=1353890 RepID=A0A6S7C3B1_9BURK|nr:hypothetical protein LMG3441_05287 [Achromobacter kerstersii]